MGNIPVIDIFAGPGGLGEGFSRYSKGKVGFNITLSIEKDPVAHKTLLLRSFTRQFPAGKIPKEYYQYVRGEISSDELFESFPKEFESASGEAWCAELGKTEKNDVHKKIKSALKGQKNWALLGGPPCQAYSLVGRSRMLGKLREKYRSEAEKLIKSQYPKKSYEELEEFIQKKENELAAAEFHDDARHKLYEEYLEIVATHQPSIFVLENVKGILSSKLKADNVLTHILSDLKSPWNAIPAEERKKLKKPPKLYNYEIFSLTKGSNSGGEDSWKNFIVKAEDFKIPQKRHRLFLIGVRNDISLKPKTLKKSPNQISVKDVISDLPVLRSHISRKPDEFSEWSKMIVEGVKNIVLPAVEDRKFRKSTKASLLDLKTPKDFGSAFISGSFGATPKLKGWFQDKKIKGVLQHRARGHMREDLIRYFFAATTAQIKGYSPSLYEYPLELLPKHKNTENLKKHKSGKKRKVIFEDRFRVQVAEKPATTITSHISQDGHYYIHYDPSQCRSLTVREAARIQTFPDNYFFEGNRTQQYHQVGNAVPPYLALQIAEVVADLFGRMKRSK